MIVDTSGLLALFNANEPQHDAVRQVVDKRDEPLVVSPFVIAEVDYLVATRLGVDAELAVLKELASGAYHLPTFTEADLTTAARIVARYRDQKIGLTDASLVVLAAQHRTRTILTLDRRHFSLVRPMRGHHFQLLP